MKAYVIQFVCRNGYIGKGVVLAENSELALKAAERKCKECCYDVVSMDVLQSEYTEVM